MKAFLKKVVRAIIVLVLVAIAVVVGAAKYRDHIEVVGPHSYTVVVKNTHGAVVDDVKIQVGDEVKTTDANGLAVFSLVNGTYEAQVAGFPANTYSTGTTKVKFGDNRVATIVVEEAIELTYSLSGACYAGVEVSVFAAANGQYTVPVTDGVTDENGAFKFFGREGNQYMVIATVDAPFVAPDYPTYFDLSAADYETDGEAWIDVVSNGSFEYPYFVYDNEFAVDAPVGASETWYRINFVSADAMISVNDTAASVKIGNDVYTIADMEEGATAIVVPLAEYAMMGRGGVTFAICYNNEGSVAVDVDVALTYPAGNVNNPILLESLDDLATVEFPEAAQTNEVYFSWVADVNGTIYVKADNEFVSFAINNYGKSDWDIAKYGDRVYGTEYAIADVEIGDRIEIVACTNDSANGNCPAATVNFENVVYVDYVIYIVDVDGKYYANETVYIVDEYEETAAIVNTNIQGYAYVTLPKGNYTASTYAAPVGYACADTALYAEEDNMMLIYEYPSTDCNMPTIFNPDQMSWQGVAYMGVDLAAGKTVYFSARNVAGTSLNITGVNDDTVATLGYVNEDGEWVVTSTFTAVYDMAAWSNVITIAFPADAADIMGICYFALSAGDMDAMGVSISVPPVVGTMDNPIEAVIGENEDADTSISSDGAVFYTFVPTEDGTLTVTVVSQGTDGNIATVTINDPWNGVYGDTTDGEASAEVSAWSEIQIIVGTNNWTNAIISVTITFTPAA